MCTHLSSGRCRLTESDEGAHGADLKTVSSSPQESPAGLSSSSTTPAHAAKSLRNAPGSLLHNREEQCRCQDRNMIVSECLVELVSKQFLERSLTNIFQLRERAATEDKSENDMPKSYETTSVFFSVTKPKIRTADYVERLVKYAQCSESAFVVCMVYLKRLAVKNEMLKITSYNLHRLLITALVLAAKMLDDRCYTNVHYARVGGIAAVPEMNRLELEMLKLLDYRLTVTPEDYQLEVDEMRRYLPPATPCPPCKVSKKSFVMVEADPESKEVLIPRPVIQPHMSREENDTCHPWLSALSAVHRTPRTCALARS